MPPVLFFLLPGFPCCALKCWAYLKSINVFKFLSDSIMTDPAKLDHYLSGYNASKLLKSINLNEISRNALNKSLSEIRFFDDAGYSYTPSKINKNVNSAFQLIGFNGKAFVKEGVISTDSLSAAKLQNP